MATTTATTTTSVTQYDYDPLGASGTSAVIAGAGDDKLYGGSGNDVMDGGAGSDDVKAGSGGDLMIYNLSANLGGAKDTYTGGSGIDAVRMQLTMEQWTDPAVRFQLERYVAHLATVQRNPIGEVSNGIASDFVFSFANGTTLTVQMAERLEVAVLNGTQYWVIDHLAALVTGTSTGSVLEAGGIANGTAGNPTATGNLDADDLDGPDDSFVAAAAGTASHGMYTVTAAGVWTYTLDNSNVDVQALNTTSTPLTDSFIVMTADGVSQTVTVTIDGANDAAVITGTSTGSLVEAGGTANAVPGTPTATGDLLATDVDNAADTFQAVASAGATTNGYGTYAVTAAGVWTYTLDNTNATVQALNTASVPLADSFTVKSEDGTEQTVTVTIHGANDAAVITGTSTGSLVEAGGAANAVPGTPTATGDLLATDVDNAADTFQAVASAGATSQGYGTYTLSAAGAWVYTLDNTNAAVQALNVSSTPLTDSFTVLTADGTSQVVTVTINGANDAAVIGGVHAGSVQEDSATTTSTGTLTAADVDDTSNLFQAAAAGAATLNGYGTYGVTTGGVWTYTLDNSNAVVNALNTGGVLTDSFTVLSADDTSQTVDITINGATDIVNHTPTNITLTATDPGAGSPSGVLAAISTADTDVGDTHVYSIVSASAAIFSISGSNLLTTGLSGNTTYTLEIQTTDSAAATCNETFNIILGTGAVNTLPAGGTGLSTDDVLYGLNQNDIMFGGTGDDTLFGQAGADQLHGGTGNDTLAGGSGSDAFVFDTAPNGSSNVDEILDFVSGTDKIVLTHSVFTALGVGAVGVGAFDIVGVGPVADANTRLIYDQASGALSYDADGTGAGAAIQFATLVANTTLTAADFTIL